MSDAKRVLVVDDEESVVSYLTALLQDNGYETLSASNGEEGLAAVKAEKPDLVTLDMSMPEKSGLRLYRDIKEDAELAATPVVIVTGVTGYGGKSEAFEKFLKSRKQIPEPEGFVAKPVDQDEFLRVVGEILP